MIRSSCTFSNDREKEHRNYLLRARLIENLHYLVFEKNTYIYIYYILIYKTLLLAVEMKLLYSRHNRYWYHEDGRTFWGKLETLMYQACISK